MTEKENKSLERFSPIASSLLWECQAIKVSIESPFRLTSGNFSPIYVNCRLLISSLVFMRLFQAYGQAVLESIGSRVKVLAGGETAGIPFAAFLSSSLGLPMVYVRKRAKEHGVASLVEGTFEGQSNVMLVEDLITDAGSKAGFIEALRSTGGNVDSVLVVFDRQQGGKEKLDQMGIQLFTMTTMNTALETGERMSFASRTTIEEVRDYLGDPEAWHSLRGLEFVRS